MVTIMNPCLVVLGNASFTREELCVHFPSGHLGRQMAPGHCLVGEGEYLSFLGQSSQKSSFTGA